MPIGRNDFGSIGAWNGFDKVPPATWICGYCSDKVSSIFGYTAGLHQDGSGATVAIIRICPSCKGPTVFIRDQRMPGHLPGREVSNVTDDLSRMFAEARLSASVGAFTASVMASRKMLMNIAVAEGADEGQSFLDYVNYLANNGFVPPKGKAWVDYIRKKGNEANHQIELMNEEDASALLTFVENLLAFIYELPAKVPKSGSAS